MTTDRRWHVPDDTLAAWLKGTTGEAEADSVEQHLIGCPHCRNRIAAAPVPNLGFDLDEAWIGIADRIAPQRPTWAARLAARVGVSEADATLLSAVAAFRLAWITGLAVLLTLTVIASGWHPVRALHVYLLVAPLIPVAGVAASYGPRSDPTHELALAAPYSKLRLLLLRSTAVLVAGAPLTIAAGLLLQPWWAGIAWLMPALAFVSVTLVVSTWQSTERAAVAVTVVWLGASAVALVAEDPLALVGSAAMGIFAAVIVASAFITIRRSDQLAATNSLA